MAAQQQVFDFLKDTLGQSSILAIAGEMMPFSNGSFFNARFISQLLFWADDREEWTAIPHAEWQKVAKLSRYAIEKARYYFSTIGVLEYKVKKDRQGNPTCHYKLNFKVLMSELKKFFKSPRTPIFSSYADSFKTRGVQVQAEVRTNTNPQYKERIETKNLGQKVKQETKKQKVDKYEKFYL